MATRMGADKSHGPRLQARKGTKGRPSKGSKRTTGAAGGREDDSTDSLRAVIMPWELRAEERRMGVRVLYQPLSSARHQHGQGDRVQAQLLVSPRRHAENDAHGGYFFRPQTAPTPSKPHPQGATEGPRQALAVRTVRPFSAALPRNQALTGLPHLGPASATPPTSARGSDLLSAMSTPRLHASTGGAPWSGGWVHYRHNSMRRSPAPARPATSRAPARPHTTAGTVDMRLGRLRPQSAAASAASQMHGKARAIGAFKSAHKKHKDEHQLHQHDAPAVVHLFGDGRRCDSNDGDGAASAVITASLTKSDPRPASSSADCYTDPPPLPPPPPAPPPPPPASPRRSHAADGRASGWVPASPSRAEGLAELAQRTSQLRARQGQAGGLFRAPGLG